MEKKVLQIYIFYIRSVVLLSLSFSPLYLFILITPYHRICNLLMYSLHFSEKVVKQ